MKKINWLWGVLFAIVGLLIIIFPKACVKIVSILLGLSAMAYGVYSLIDSKKVFQDDNFFKTSSLIKGCGTIFLGLLTVILPLVATAWKVMVYIFAIYLILSAAFGFYTVSVLKDNLTDRKRYIGENLSLLVAGVLLILISPENLGIFIVRIIGIAGLLVGLVLVGIQVFNIINHKKDIVVSDAEVVDEPVAEESEDKTE